MPGGHTYVGMDDRPRWDDWGTASAERSSRRALTEGGPCGESRCYGYLGTAQASYTYNNRQIGLALQVFSYGLHGENDAPAVM